MPGRKIFLCIGGNLGEREANLEETRMFLSFNFGEVELVSSIYETEAWGMTDAPNFLNQVVQITSDLTNEELLAEIAELEDFYGRERSSDEYLSREMDVDVLFIGDEIIESEKLNVPHPRMHLRRFVLEPMNEIAPDFVHPVFKKTIAELLKVCPDTAVPKKV